MAIIGQQSKLHTVRDIHPPAGLLYPYFGIRLCRHVEKTRAFLIGIKAKASKVVALVMGYDTLLPIFAAAAIGFLLAVPAAFFVAKQSLVNK